MKVRELMTKQVASVRPGERASNALRMMWDCDCGTLPVTEDGGRVVAVVTDRDLAMTGMFRDARPSEFAVSDAMSRSLHCCSPEDSVGAAAEIMRRVQIRRLPVVDGERRLVGILSQADIVRSAADRKRTDVVPEEVTATLAEISSPRYRPEASPRA
jgi:CBS-domain-containing membrane protein